MTKAITRVLIVGAGITGLTLNECLQSEKFIVDFIEASDKPGGRIKFSKNNVSLGPVLHHFTDPITLTSPYKKRLDQLGINLSLVKEYLRKDTVQPFRSYNVFSVEDYKFWIPADPAFFEDNDSDVDPYSDSADYFKLVNSYDVSNLQLHTKLVKVRQVDSKLVATLKLESENSCWEEKYDYIFYTALPRTLKQIDVDAQLIRDYEPYFNVLKYVTNYMVNISVDLDFQDTVALLNSIAAPSQYLIEKFKHKYLAWRFDDCNIYLSTDRKQGIILHVFDSTAERSSLAEKQKQRFTKDPFFANSISIVKILDAKKVNYQFYDYTKDPLLSASWCEINSRWTNQSFLKLLTSQSNFKCLGGYLGLLPLKVSTKEYLFFPLTDTVHTCYCYANFFSEFFKSISQTQQTS